MLLEEWDILCFRGQWKQNKNINSVSKSMITVKHVFKDGTTVNDVTGHIVRLKDAEAVYTLVDRMNERYINEKRTDNAK